jgi:anti-sigma regulatory factor (Ser/Thr protein kinase)
VQNDKLDPKQRALELVAAETPGIGTKLANELGVSRQVANGYLQALVRDGLLEGEGTTRAKVYRLKTLAETDRAFAREGLDEFKVWQDVIAPLMRDLPRQTQNIWSYACTEMVNNAMDHSGANKVTVRVRKNALFTEVLVADDGEGIFLKIQRALGLPDPRESILELAKGKLTTDPKNHSGEGIFFTSRAMDVFAIESHHLVFSHQPRAADRISEHAADVPGTRVRMQLRNDSQTNLEKLFGDFTSSEENTFDRTVVPLRLAQHEGDQLISRSQAKRVAHRFERFREVELDFTGIEQIGQGFADELFRVFANAHPQIRLVPINTAPAVDRMIRRVTAGQNEGK